MYILNISDVSKINFIKYSNHHNISIRVRFMVLNGTFNNISVILWQSILLVKETGVP